MAREGRSATRNGDVHNIIADLETGDRIDYQYGAGEVIDIWKSQVSTWGIARLVAVRAKTISGGPKRQYLMTTTIKAPGVHSFDGQFNVVVHEKGTTEIGRVEVTG